MLPGPLTERASGLVRTWQQERREMQAPELLRYEMTNALYRVARSGRFTPDEALAGLEALSELPVRLTGSPARTLRAFEIAFEFGFGAAYDAQYLALAEELGAEFRTADHRLARAAAPSRPWVHGVEPA